MMPSREQEGIFLIKTNCMFIPQKLINYWMIISFATTLNPNIDPLYLAARDYTTTQILTREFPVMNFCFSKRIGY